MEIEGKKFFQSKSSRVIDPDLYETFIDPMELGENDYTYGYPITFTFSKEKLVVLRNED